MALEEGLNRLPAAMEKMRVDNERATADAAAARQKALEEARALPMVFKANVEALRRLEEDNDLQVKLTEQQAKSSAGQALALKAELESQGKELSKSGKFQKLSFKARQDAKKEELKSAETPAQRKQIQEDMRADARKNGSLLQKIGAGIGGLFEMGKKGLKKAALGGMALLSTLAIGGLLIALGKFLQSDTFKTLSKYIEETLWPILQSFGETIMEFFQGPTFAAMMKYIRETLIPKLKSFYDAFFGPEGGFINGFQCLFSDDSGIGLIVLGIMGVVALLTVKKLAAIFGPLGVAIGLLLGGFKALTKLVKSKTPKIPKTTVPTTPGTAGTPLKTTTPIKTPTVNPSMTNAKGQQIGKSNKVLAGAALEARNEKIGRFKAGGASKSMTTAQKLAMLSKKFPRIGKTLKIVGKAVPGLGIALAGAQGLSILMGDSSKEEKIKALSGLLGGTVAALVLGAGGATLGTMMLPGIGTGVGALLGGAAGYFGGEYVAGKLASFLLGEELKPEDLMPPTEGTTAGVKRHGAKKQQVVANISKNVGDVMADRRIAGGAYKPGQGQDMGEDFEEPSTQMANFQRAKIKRAADTNSNGGSPAINVNAPSNKNITNNGGMSSGGGSLRPNKFGNLNQRYVRDEGV